MSGFSGSDFIVSGFVPVAVAAGFAAVADLGCSASARASAAMSLAGTVKLRAAGMTGAG
jgi:hypothetical protein